MFGLSSDQDADGSKRLVLGYDGGCCTCSGMAERIKERVGDKLEVMSLRNPQVQEWREKALGKMLLGLQPSSRLMVPRFGPGQVGGWVPS